MRYCRVHQQCDPRMQAVDRMSLILLNHPILTKRDDSIARVGTLTQRPRQSFPQGSVMNGPMMQVIETENLFDDEHVIRRTNVQNFHRQ